MARAKPSHKGKKSAKKASVKYCKVCKRSHGGPVNHRCLIAGTTKVVRYIMANNISAQVFDNSSSGSEASPPTPREPSDENVNTSSQRDMSRGATASPDDNTSHIRTLFTNDHHMSPITEPTAQASHDNVNNPQTVTQSQPTAGATVTTDASGNQPPSGITIVTNNTNVPSGVSSIPLNTGGQNLPARDMTSTVVQQPRFSFQSNAAPAAPNMAIANSGTLLSTLRAARGAAANYDPNAPPAPRAQPQAPHHPRTPVSFANTQAPNPVPTTVPLPTPQLSVQSPNQSFPPPIVECQYPSQLRRLQPPCLRFNPQTGKRRVSSLTMTMQHLSLARKSRHSSPTSLTP